MTKYLCIPHILGSTFSYMALQPLPSEFPYILGKFNFLFYQCSCRIPVISCTEHSPQPDPEQHFAGFFSEDTRQNAECRIFTHDLLCHFNTTSPVPCMDILDGAKP